MTNIDFAFGILLIAFLVWGMVQGLLWTLVRLASLAGVILVISSFGEGFRYQLSDFLRVSPAVATLIFYIVIFVVMMILARVLYIFLKKIMKTLRLGCMNRLAGGFFAVLCYFVLLSFLVILIDISPLSLNGRGVRPANQRSNFRELTLFLEEEINSRRADMSEIDIDRLWEALDKAREKNNRASDDKTRDRAMSEFLETMRVTLRESEFAEVHAKLEKQSQQNLKFEGKEITIPSLLIMGVIEPLADYLEINLMGMSIS
jgi:uncharacterized membrane protein required for colicin V production